MITITIGQASREWSGPDDVEESWIAQQINERYRRGEAVCVFVRIVVPGVELGMVAGQCGSNYAPGPPLRLSDDEEKIVALWRERTSKNGRVDPGEIIGFFKQLRRLV